MMVTLEVTGLPQPKGSKNKGAQGQMYESAAGLPDWMDRVRWMALKARPRNWDQKGAMAVDATFYRHRPVGTPKRIVFPATRPDVDKLSRAILDACTKVLWHDDGQVVDLDTHKRFGEPHLELTVVNLDYPTEIGH